MTPTEAIDTLKMMLIVNHEKDVPARDLAIEALRKVSSTPEIIRCKDCRYFQRETPCESTGPYKSCREQFDNLGYQREVDDDDFCSFAERRKK